MTIQFIVYEETKIQDFFVEEKYINQKVNERLMA